LFYFRICPLPPPDDELPLEVLPVLMAPAEAEDELPLDTLEDPGELPPEETSDPSFDRAERRMMPPELRIGRTPAMADEIFSCGL